MEIAITGATGFIGAVLVPQLIAKGYKLRLLTRRKIPSPEKGVIWVPGSLENKESLVALTKGADILIHLAAVISVSDGPNEEVQQLNTEGTRLLFEAAKESGVRRAIHLSSITVFNQYPYREPLDETRALIQTTVPGYDYSKAVSQQIALSYNQEGMEVIVLAPTAVVGPFDKQPSLLGKAIINIYRGKLPALFPGGVDLVDVRDVVHAIIQSIDKGRPGKVYILGGDWKTLKELAKAVGKARGRKVLLPVVPLWLVFGMLPLVRFWASLTGGPPYYTKTSVYNLIYSNRKIDHRAAEELDFHPRPFETTIKDTVEWFKQTGYIK